MGRAEEGLDERWTGRRYGRSTRQPPAGESSASSLSACSFPAEEVIDDAVERGRVLEKREGRAGDVGPEDVQARLRYLLGDVGLRGLRDVAALASDHQRRDVN